jgi:hypothetical protein
MSSSLRTRVAAWSLLPIAAVALWLLFGPGRGLAEADEADPGATDAGDLAAAQLDANVGSDAAAADLSRSRVDALVGLDGDGGAGGDDAPVHLRVLLRVLDDEGEERIPPACAGWTVRAQSWIRETGEVFAHEARTDARGVAEFTFTGFTHVDWAGCAPPQSSGFGFSQMSEHTDFDAGSAEEWTLHLQPGGAAHGRVLTLDDRPVAGAEVHAFDPSWSGDFEIWTPGFLTTRTSADGGFRFPSLGTGDWIFAVAPGERLQVVPSLGDAQEGQGYAQVEAGADVDVGVLRVISATTHEVRVVDADGGGVAGLTFAISALSFASSTLRATQEFVPEEDEDPTASWTQRFLAGEDPGAWLEAAEAESDEEESEEEDRVDWPYDGVARDTDADGCVSWQLPPGAYRIECWSSVPGMPDGTIPTFDVQVPGPPTLFRLAVSRAAWAGRVVDDLGAPVESASIVLTWRSEDGATTWDDEAATDAHGAFRFENAPLLRDCELTISSGQHVVTSWRVSLQEPPSAPFCLPRGARMRVIATGPDGAPVDLGQAQSRVIPLRFEVPAAAPGTLAGETRPLDVAGALYCIQNQLISNHLPTGEYELRLHLSAQQSTFLLNAWGFLHADTHIIRAAESVLIGTWQVRTGDEPNRITLDAEQCALLAPTPERHVGVVLDAETGEPVRGALVTALGRTTVGARTGDDGRFELEADSTLTGFEVEAQGYERLHVDAAAAAGAEHEFRMQHAGAMVHLRVFDRDGRWLPPCTVDLLFPGAAGGFPPTTPEQGLAGMQLPEGEIYFHSRTPGRHRVRVSFAPEVHAECSFDLSQTRDYEPVDVRIGMSLAEIRAALLAAPR